MSSMLERKRRKVQSNSFAVVPISYKKDCECRARKVAGDWGGALWPRRGIQKGELVEEIASHQDEEGEGIVHHLLLRLPFLLRLLIDLGLALPLLWD